MDNITDWEDALLKKGHQQDYSLSVSGGNEKSNFIGFVEKLLLKK